MGERLITASAQPHTRYTIHCVANFSNALGLSSRTRHKMNINTINATYFPEEDALVTRYEVSTVNYANEPMFKHFFVSLWFLALASCVIFPFVARIRMYIAQYSEALEWLLHGPQLLRKRYVSFWSQIAVIAAVLTRQSGSGRTIPHQNTKSSISPGILTATH
jgi:ABC-type transport system involved in Fe-S cluster assembly fused permease/ATPase subunit